MLDINLFRTEKGGDPELIRKSQRSRSASVQLVDEVMGESKRKEEYICFLEHLCTCYSFYDIVGCGKQLCLAALLAEAVSKHQEIEVTDEELAHMLAKL